MSCVLSSSVKAKLLSLLVHCYFLFMLSCKQERLSLLFANVSSVLFRDERRSLKEENATKSNNKAQTLKR